MKNLYILTASYPYGYQESFLEEELQYLSGKFDSILIIPFGGHHLPKRQMPYNCSVLTFLKGKRAKKVLLGCLSFWRVLPKYLNDIIKYKGKLTIKDYKRWLSTLLMTSFYRSNSIFKCLNNLNREDVIYSYWGADFCNVFVFLKTDAKCISRFHGFWDLWEDRDNEGYIPLRKPLLDKLTFAITISYLGEDFLRARYTKNEIKTFHLGTRDNGHGLKSEDGIVRVLSCSSVYGLKRVNLIGKLLSEVKNTKIEWTHIGDGSDFEQLIKECNELASDSLKINLLGRLSHNDVLDYYKKHPVDVFINMSTSEGIPVAIMEAISFDVPVIATNVGGTSEIVTEETGVLLSPNPTATEFREAFNSIRLNNYSPRLFWEQQFASDKNYSDFATFLFNL